MYLAECSYNNQHVCITYAPLSPATGKKYLVMQTFHLSGSMYVSDWTYKHFGWALKRFMRCITEGRPKENFRSWEEWKKLKEKT